MSEWVNAWVSEWVNEWESEWVNSGLAADEIRFARSVAHAQRCYIIVCPRLPYWGSRFRPLNSQGRVYKGRRPKTTHQTLIMLIWLKDHRPQTHMDLFAADSAHTKFHSECIPIMWPTLCQLDPQIWLSAVTSNYCSSGHFCFLFNFGDNCLN